MPAVAVVALALAACGGADDGDGAGGEGTVGTAGPFPSVEGEFGQRPTLAFPDDDPSADLQASVLTEGEGEVVEAGDLLLAHYFGQVWDGAIFDNSYDRGAPADFPIGAGRVIEGWDTGLVGQRVGSRVVLTVPPDQGYGSEGNEQAGIRGTDTLVFVVDVVGAYGPQQSGDAAATPTAEAAAAGPQVEGEPGSPPQVSVPEGTAEPDELTTTVLARSDGPPVVAGQAVVQWAGRFWDDSGGESTWELGQPQLIEVGAGGAFDELVGIPVGSRVLQELPSRGDQPAIALVVDIVAQDSVE